MNRTSRLEQCGRPAVRTDVHNKYLLGSLVVLALLLAPACQSARGMANRQDSVDHFDRLVERGKHIRLGMSKAAVRRILGDPDGPTDDATWFYFPRLDGIPFGTSPRGAILIEFDRYEQVSMIQRQGDRSNAAGGAAAH